MNALAAAIRTLEGVQPARIVGRVEALRGLTVLVRDLPMPVGSLVRVDRAAAPDNEECLGEIVGFDGPRTIVMTLTASGGVRAGDRVVGLHPTQTVAVGPALLGRVIDGLGRPIDGRGRIEGSGGTVPRAIDPAPVSPLARARITEPMHTGVRAIDLMTTFGRGQRMGVFAGPGVGKSTLLGAVARNAKADAIVVALIGERGREVRDFIEHNLGPEGLRRSVVVVATSDESPVMRARAALVACAAAEEFRDRGQAVMLIMDSVTRYAHAQRQIGLSVGEPPATRGYTPSVFAGMARLLERAGTLAPSAGSTAPGGSITGLYSVLVEGDDMTEPIADAARGILDGHLILSRALAQKSHYPAIDVLDSVSRVADDVCDAAHTAARRQIVRFLAAYKQVEDLVQIGAYSRGSNPAADVAIRYRDAMLDLLQQDLKSSEPFEQSRGRMLKLAIETGALFQQLSSQPAGPQPGAQPQTRRN